MPCTDPIILVGTQRSGTTWLGSVFSEAPEIAYWAEPRHVWVWGHWFRSDDRFTAADASPRIARHILETFARYVRRRGADRLCEKTPSNCLRLPFVRAVLPNARILLIVRDGRAVLRSTEEQRQAGPSWERIRQRACETPLWEWPAYLSRAGWLIDRARGRPARMWGVRPPGWADWLDADPPIVVLAKQWARATTCAVEDGRRQPPDRFMRIRYEDLVAEPRRVMRRVAEFLRLASVDAIVARTCETASPGSAERWRSELDDATLARVRPHMEPTLAELGYAW